MLTEVYRVLKPGGVFIQVTPNWKYSIRKFYDDPTHVRPYSEESISELLSMYGFIRIKVVPWLVKKPNWMWQVPFSFTLARYIPFRGDTFSWIPKFLTGKTKSILVLAIKPK